MPAQAALAADFDGDPATTERIDQSDPVAAAIDISTERFEDDAAEYVVLSRDDLFADSLAGSSLTSVGPLLFTETDALPDTTGAEIDRVLADGALVYLLGGTAAISQAVEDQLEADGYETRRLSGPSRIETAIAVADEVRSRLVGPGDLPKQALLARAYGTDGSDDTAAWADSVTAGAYAAPTATPILLTPTAELHSKTAAWLSEDAPDRTIVLGGEAAISTTVHDQVPNPERVAGPAREDTAAAIARTLYGTPATGERSFVIIDGYRTDGWAYGLAAAGIAGDHRAPILLVHTDSVPASTLELVAACDVPEVDLLLIGSETVISAEREETLDSVDGTPCQSAVLSGANEVDDGDDVAEGDPDGSGEAFLVNVPDQGIACVLWENIVGITLPSAAAHIHQGDAGVNGPVVVTLDQPMTAGPEWGCRTDADPTALQSAFDDPPSFYINVHTSDFPDGAIRGQLNSVAG